MDHQRICDQTYKIIHTYQADVEKNTKNHAAKVGITLETTILANTAKVVPQTWLAMNFSRQSISAGNTD